MGLGEVFGAAMVVAVFATVLSLGLSTSAGQLIAPLRRPGRIAVLVVINVVVIPLMAWGAVTIAPLSEPAATALVLSAIGAGGAGGLKAAQLSGLAWMPLAVCLVCVLQVANLVAVPVWVGMVLGPLTLPPGQMFGQLVVLVLAPLALGLVLRSRWSGAGRATPGIVTVSNISLGVGIMAGLVTSWEALTASAGTWLLPTAALIVIGGMLLGVGPVRKDPAAAASAGMVSGMRFTALALMVIGSAFDNATDYLAPALVYALIDLVLSIAVGLAVGRWWRSRGAAAVA